MATYVPLPITLTNADNLVVEQMDRLNDLADDLIDSAQDALNNLLYSYINTAELDPRFEWDDADLEAILNQLGNLPAPDLTDDWLSNLDLPPASEFVFNQQVLDAVTEQLPNYVLPPMPTLPPMPAEPADPGEPVDIAAPLEPTLPSREAPSTELDEPAPVYADYTASVPLPTLRPIELPDVPVLQLNSIAFEGVRPNFDELVTPDAAQFQFTPNVYEPLLVDELTTAIKSVLQGGTGIPAEVEDAIFEQAREREIELGERDVSQARDEYSAKGYKYPPGAVGRRVDRARKEASGKVSGMNREQFVTRWRLEVEQFRAVLSSAIALEEMWVGAFDRAERLRFEAARMQLDFALQVFNALITKINAQAQLYATDAQVMRDRIAAEEAKIRAYAAELEAKRIIGELNEQDVRIFVARVQALQTNAEIYRARVEGYVAKFREIDARIDVFRAQLEQDKSLADIYETNVRAFGIKNEAQQTRDERFRIRAQLFSTKTEGVKTQYDALLTAYNQNFKIAELQRDTFIANSERVKTMIAAESGRIDAVVSRYQAISAQVQTMSQAEQARYSAMLAFAQANIERMKAAADILMKNGEINIQSALQAQNIMVRARETAATTLAQLAAGLTSAANVNASISNSYSNGIHYGYQGELDIA